MSEQQEKETNLYFVKKDDLTMFEIEASTGESALEAAMAYFKEANPNVDPNAIKSEQFKVYKQLKLEI